MKLILSHPTGNSNVRAVLSGLFDKEMLAEFHTTIAFKKNAFGFKKLPLQIRNELERRTFNLPHSKIYTHPWREGARMILPKLGFNNITRHEHGWASIDQVYCSLDKDVANRISILNKKNKITGVYAYEDGALATFTRAKQLGLQCIYDMPIAYWQTLRNLLNIEALRVPAWKKTLGGGILDSAKKLERKTRELELADVIVSPGKFVIDSLPIWAKKKKFILSPFGSPELSKHNNHKFVTKPSDFNRPLRVLFAGSMGQRKGLADLFAAFRLVKSKHIELVVIGSLLDKMSFYKNEFADFIYEPTRPHNEVLDLMRSCDVFCLPSIVEGRALVMQEAMSQGLPLIITENTGGEDLIQENKTGFLVPIRSPEIIAQKITWFANNRNQIQEMGENAKRVAAQYTWKQYGETIVKELARNSIKF